MCCMSDVTWRLSEVLNSLVLNHTISAQPGDLQFWGLSILFYDSWKNYIQIKLENVIIKHMSNCIVIYLIHVEKDITANVVRR